jgi:UDP-glucose 4-epimerase
VRVLVTGDRGFLGRAVVDRLRAAGYRVSGFDRAAGADILDADALRDAAGHCTAVVHLAAIPSAAGAGSERVMAVNVLGTWHVLLAAERSGVDRVVTASSMQALGIAEGERLPDRFPIDDRHPRRAARPYGLSKRLAEDLVEAFTARTGVPSVCLRPVAVWGPDGYAEAFKRWSAEPAAEWTPFWEYGAFVDVRDVASAVVASLEADVTGHVRALLCAQDIGASAPTLEMVERLAPAVPWSDGRRAEYEADPWRALVDTSVAREVLGWLPAYSWRDWRATT